MGDSTFDLVVVGTGPSASTVARQASEEDRRVAIIESRAFGGTCALRGCNPKKVYANAAYLMAQIRGADGKLVSSRDAAIDWKQLAAFKREFTESIPEKSEASFRDAGIETIQGTARFRGPDQIDVGDRVLDARRFVIGTGARPVKLDIEGEEHLIHSDRFLELDQMPPRVVFVGGGYVSMEFAHVVARYGSDVTVLERNDRILRAFDPDLTSQLSDWSKSQGIDIHCNAEAKRIRRADDAFEVVFEHDGDEKQLICDLVVHGAGRVPNLDELNLESANVDRSKKGIVVDQYLRSKTNPLVFACGDCADTGRAKLTPAANEEARAVSKNLFAEQPDYTLDAGPIPQVAYTAPPIASVGMREDEARESGHEPDVRHEDTSSWNSVRKTGVTCGGYKLIIDTSTDRILGAHLLGPSAEETINLFTLAMKHDLTATDIKSTLFAFPTFASDVRQMV